MRLYRFSNDGSLFRSKARADDMEGIWRINDVKAQRVGRDAFCEEWSYPLRGFGPKIRMPLRKRTRCMMAVIGESYMLSPIRGAAHKYRSGETVNADAAEQLSDQAEYAGAQLGAANKNTLLADRLEHSVGWGLLLLIVLTAVHFLIVRFQQGSISF